MKKNKMIAVGSCIMLLTACNNNPALKDNGKTEPGKEPALHQHITDKKAGKFGFLDYALSRDTICGMPLSAGVADTLMVDGEIYGFCAKACKEQFAQALKDREL